MKVEQQVPLLWEKCPALNDALEAEKNGNYLPRTRVICISEEKIFRTILRRPTIGPGNRIIDMNTGPYKLAESMQAGPMVRSDRHHNTACSTKRDQAEHAINNLA